MSMNTTLQTRVCRVFSDMTVKFARFPPAKKNRGRTHRPQYFIKLARPEGFEPPTPWFVAKYSIQMSYGRKKSEANYSITEPKTGGSEPRRHAVSALPPDTPAVRVKRMASSTDISSGSSADLGTKTVKPPIW